MSFGDVLRAKSIQQYGWDALGEKDQERLLKDLWERKIIDLKDAVPMAISEVFSIQEIQNLLVSDTRLLESLYKKYGKLITIKELIEYIRHSPILQQIIVTKTANKINRVMAYLILRKGELSEDEYNLLGMLLMKFGNPIGCSTPEMFEEKCKEELEELLELNKGEKHASEKNTENKKSGNKESGCHNPSVPGKTTHNKRKDHKQPLASNRV